MGEGETRKPWHCAEIQYCLCALWKLHTLGCFSTRKNLVVLAVARREVLALVPSRGGLSQGSALKLMKLIWSLYFDLNLL